MFGIRTATRSLLGNGAFRAPALRVPAAALLSRWFSVKIIYTHTDEAPALATYALLPVIKRFTDPAGVIVEHTDISVSGRIIAHFPEKLTAAQQQSDHLAELGQLAKTPEANIIKLPNISASIPQLKEAIAELRSQGYDIPKYPEDPKNDEEKAIKERYAKVLGSAVNPVLREGNSDRRVADPVKAYAKKHPTRLGAWSPSCKTHVAYMPSGDFFGSEKSTVMAAPTVVRIEHVSPSGTITVLKEKTSLLAEEVIDASVMSKSALREYFEREMTDAKANGIMLSLHLKATMMKISDPIMFGHAVSVYLKDVFQKHAALFKEMGVNPNNGLEDLYKKIAKLPEDKRKAVEADIAEAFKTRPGLAMVNSDKGITNLHVPSDVIVDASMPVVVRDSGKMWNKDNKLEETKCLIPDRCYARVYQEVFDDCRKNGQFDASTMGHVANVGLMAQKAEEYGSHDKTFEIKSAGVVRVVDSATDRIVFEHQVEQGDIWRMCQTKDSPIKDWVELAVRRARFTGAKTIFWLDPARPHDANLIVKVNKYLKGLDTSGLDIEIMTPEAAVRATMARARSSKDTVSVTGNVLRDYLTDLFPILELGTSAKMLSIVPLLAGGGMFETGAGGSAPKHVEQFVEEGHLRWDSLGEYLAVVESLIDLGIKTKNQRAEQLGHTLSRAVGKVLDNRKSPSRKVNEIDNRGTTYYIAKYWAEEMALQDKSFAQLAQKLAENEAQITSDMIKCQGKPVDIGGYYRPDTKKAEAAMRPSALFNSILEKY